MLYDLLHGAADYDPRRDAYHVVISGEVMQEIRSGELERQSYAERQLLSARRELSRFIHELAHVRLTARADARAATDRLIFVAIVVWSLAFILPALAALPLVL